MQDTTCAAAAVPPAHEEVAESSGRHTRYAHETEACAAKAKSADAIGNQKTSASLESNAEDVLSKNRGIIMFVLICLLIAVFN